MKTYLNQLKDVLQLDDQLMVEKFFDDTRQIMELYEKKRFFGNILLDFFEIYVKNKSNVGFYTIIWIFRLGYVQALQDYRITSKKEKRKQTVSHQIHHPKKSD